jgi:hypothetical protein
MVERALRTGLRTGDDTRHHLTYQWRCDVLTMVDRLDLSLQMSTEGVASAQRDRQGWALSIFETGRGRQLLQMGRLADAEAALEGQLTVDMASHIVSVLDAAGVVALGRVAIHVGDAGLSRRAREIAQVMMGQSAPSVRHHAAWLLALQEMAAGNAACAHESLGAFGEKERMGIVSLFPMDVADEARLIHIALAAHDDELAASAAEAAECRARLNPHIRSMAAAAAHARGLLHRNPVDLAEAATLYADGPRPLAWAAALEDLGAATVERGSTDEAVETFGRALEGPAQSLGRAPPPRGGEAPGYGLGGHDRLRARGGEAGGAGFDQSGGGWAPLRLPAHCQRAPPPCLRQVGRELTRRADPIGRVARPPAVGGRGG